MSKTTRLSFKTIGSAGSYNGILRLQHIRIRRFHKQNHRILRILQWDPASATYQKHRFCKQNDRILRILERDPVSATCRESQFHKQSDRAPRILQLGFVSAAFRNHRICKQSIRIRWILEWDPGLGGRCCKEGAVSQAVKEKISKAKWRTSVSIRMVRRGCVQTARAARLRADRSGGETT